MSSRSRPGTIAVWSAISAARGRTSPSGACTTRAGALASRSGSPSTTASSRWSSSTRADAARRAGGRVGGLRRACAARRLAGMERTRLGVAGDDAAADGGGAGRQGAGPRRLRGARPRLRRAFWGESRCVSLRHVILEVAAEMRRPRPRGTGRCIRLRPRSRGPLRAVRGRPQRCGQGSPHLFLADGTNVENPGIEATWDRGSDGFWRPTMVADDPAAYDRLPRAPLRVEA